MNEAAKEKIIREFESAVQYTSDEISPISIDALRIATKNNNSDNICYKEICLELMQILTNEIRLKNTNQQKEIEMLSQEEKYFLESIYK